MWDVSEEDNSPIAHEKLSEDERKEGRRYGGGRVVEKDMVRR